MKRKHNEVISSPKKRKTDIQMIQNPHENLLNEQIRVVSLFIRLPTCLIKIIIHYWRSPPSKMARWLNNSCSEWERHLEKMLNASSIGYGGYTPSWTGYLANDQLIIQIDFYYKNGRELIIFLKCVYGDSKEILYWREDTLHSIQGDETNYKLIAKKIAHFSQTFKLVCFPFYNCSSLVWTLRT